MRRGHNGRFITEAEDRAITRRFWKAVLHSVKLGALGWGTFMAGHWYPRPMRLPPPEEIVIAYTSTGVHIAFLDSAGEFRNAETGEQIAQVINWKTP